GGLYALFAVGLTLIFGVLDVINVAHGEFFALGGYLLFAAVALLQLPPAAGVIAAGAGAFLLGLAVHPLLIAPLRRRLGRRPPRRWGSTSTGSSRSPSRSASAWPASAAPSWPRSSTSTRRWGSR